MKRYIRRLFLSSFILVLLFLARPLVPLLSPLFGEQLFQESVAPILGQVQFVLVVIVVMWMASLGIRIGKAAILRRFDTSRSDNLRSRSVHTQIEVLEKILYAVVALLGFGLILLSFENLRNLGLSLFASAGVAGIIVGLAAQKILGAVLAGVQIAITQPIRIDDAVLVENEWGWIEEIKLTYVVIRLWDKRRLVVPSTYFIEEPFQNWTRSTSDILGTVFIHVDYRFPVDVMRQELTRILESTELWDGKVQVVQVTDAGPQTMEIRVLVSASTSPRAWDLRVLVREKLVEFLQRNYPEYLPRTRVALKARKDT